MNPYKLSHLADHTMLLDLPARASRERGATAEVLAYIAEFDARRLYAPAGYPSMLQYCLHELHYSEDAAGKRVHAARAARKFPALFPALADGRLHLSAVVMLAPYLTPENAEELLAAATHQTKAEIERLLAERFPRPDLPARVQVLALPAEPGDLLALDAVARQAPPPVAQHAPGRVESVPRQEIAPRPKLTPLSPRRFGVQFTMGAGAYDKLRYAEELVGHRLAAEDMAGVFERGLDDFVHEIEKRKFAATDRPRPSRCRPRAGARYVPAAVKRAVWKRDGGRCTFVSATGCRCAARHGVEYDHIDPVARGGRATVDRMRLRCRAHNQYEAERVFAREFMDKKRQEARRAREESRRATDETPPKREETRRSRSACALPCHSWVRGSVHGFESRAL